MATAVAQPRGRVFARPTSKTGWWSWVTTVDHKRIGILYGVTAFVFFLFGGLEAFVIRLLLDQPNADVISANFYIQF